MTTLAFMGNLSVFEVLVLLFVGIGAIAVIGGIGFAVGYAVRKSNC